MTRCDDMNEEKNRLRREMKAVIAQLDAGYTKAASEKIAKRLLESDVWNKAQYVFCFAGKENEIDTALILSTALKEHKTLSVPLCTGKGVMQARIIQSLQQMHSGAYGIMEPDAQTQMQKPQEIELCIIPCLCASPDGTRLGYGGGYYDRFLKKTKQAFKVVLCREKTLTDVLLQEEHDIKADAVLTEERWLIPKQSGKGKEK